MDDFQFPRRTLPAIRLEIIVQIHKNLRVPVIYLHPDQKTTAIISGIRFFKQIGEIKGCVLKAFIFRKTFIMP